MNKKIAKHLLRVNKIIKYVNISIRFKKLIYQPTFQELIIINLIFKKNKIFKFKVIA